MVMGKCSTSLWECSGQPASPVGSIPPGTGAVRMPYSVWGPVLCVPDPAAATMPSPVGQYASDTCTPPALGVVNVLFKAPREKVLPALRAHQLALRPSAGSKDGWCFSSNGVGTC